MAPAVHLTASSRRASPAPRRAAAPAAPGAPSPLALAAWLCLASALAVPSVTRAQALPRVRPAPPPSAASAAPPAPSPFVELTADRVTARLDREAVATGDVELQRGDTTVHADSLRYDQQADRAHASGHVRVTRGLDWFTGADMDLAVQSVQGEIDQSRYHLGRTGAGGSASRFLIQDRDHATAFDATYSSCTPQDDDGSPDWILTGDRIDLDSSRNQGRAHGAVLHFLGVPILALPTMTFPTSSERVSGWLPPLGDVDNRNGFQLGVPYYWNVAPSLDATFTPQVMSKSGFALGTEVRYLAQHDLGQASTFVVPHDEVSAISRWSAQVAHDGESVGSGVQYGLRLERASDDYFWKDYPHQLPSLLPRLLPFDAQATRRWSVGGLSDAVDLDLATYARIERFQTLQAHVAPGQDSATALIVLPYQRSPQVGSRANLSAGVFHADAEAEYNRFDLSPSGAGGGVDASTNGPRSPGQRLHLTTGVEADLVESWGRFTPRVSVNGAEYHTDTPMAGGRSTDSRVIPTVSLDGQLSFDRETRLFGHSFTQTLEPRLLYVFTPFRDQTRFPIYDTAPKDFNSLSIYSDNEFTGIDRISDGSQVTAGVTTRYNDAADGRELLRLGLAQRFLFRDQRLTVQGQPITGHVSDLLLYGNSTLSDQWTLDGTVQFNPSTDRTSRAVVSARYHPGPYRTISATYRFASASIQQVDLADPVVNGSSSQYELGFQWPIYHRSRPSAGTGGCHGTLYGVGRVNYSLESHVTYAVGGLEYDAGCWTGSLIAERQSTGPNENRLHVMLQLQLVGLSNLGSGSLRVLKDNIPGYQPLRDDKTGVPNAAPTP